MPLRGGPPPEFGQLGQLGGQAPQLPPSLLQMAQGEAPDMRGGGPQGGQYENAWDNPANWGPPPPITGPMPGTQQGWFPDVFQRQDPGGKFWSMGDYLRQYYNKFGGQMPEVLDERHVNTINSQMLANPGRPNEPGAFMYLGHHISPAQMTYDLNVGRNPSGEGGGNRSPIRRIQGLGPENPASFIHGSTFATGLPGQLENWSGGSSPYWT